MTKLKSVFKSILCFLEDVGRARAAAELARAGRHEDARRLALEKCSCC